MTLETNTPTLIEIAPDENDFEDSAEIFEPPPPGSPIDPDHILPAPRPPSPASIGFPAIAVSAESLTVPTNYINSHNSGHNANKRIMVAVDESRFAVEAFDWAVDNLVQNGDELLLVHIVTTDSEDVINAMSKKIHSFFAERLRQSETAGNNDVTLIVDVRYSDSPKDAICQAATERNVKTLIIGSRGMGPIKSILLGSVSAYVVKHASVPVIVARPTKELPSFGFNH
ncbi:hypothetical protein HK098_004035 [Nowakowskiella sp. JEL0407]|nr:hypothetical protein HK098_004035 [Nowakowskiella sp. JEL0407]